MCLPSRADMLSDVDMTSAVVRTSKCDSNNGDREPKPLSSSRWRTVNLQMENTYRRDLRNVVNSFIYTTRYSIYLPTHGKMNDLSYISNSQSSYDSPPNRIIDPALLTAYQDFAAVLANHASTLGESHVSPLSETYDQYERNYSRTKLNSLQHGFDHDLGELCSSSNLTNVPTWQPRNQSPLPLLTLSELPSDDTPDYDAYLPSEPFARCSLIDATNFHHVFKHPTTICTGLANETTPLGQIHCKKPLHQLRTRQPVLEAFYEGEVYPTMEMRKLLAKIVNRDINYVTHWFSNRRARHNKGLQFLAATTESGFPTLSEPSIQFPSGRRGKRKPGNTPLPPGTAHNLTILYPHNSQLEQWPCTFCLKHMKRKEWKRHMNSHVPPAWFCMPTGRPAVDNTCVFCGLVASSTGGEENNNTIICAHFNIEMCCNKDLDRRAFPSEDKLRQHIRSVHLRTQMGDTKLSERSHHARSSVINIPKSWNIPQEYPDSIMWCGLCEINLPDWQTTIEHVSRHFRLKDRLNQVWKTREGKVVTYERDAS